MLQQEQQKQNIIIAKANYHAQTSEELSFLKGDEFIVLEEGSEWLKVCSVDHTERKGYIPITHVVTEDDDEGEEDQTDVHSFASSSAMSDYQDDDYDGDQGSDVEGETGDGLEPSKIRRRLSKLVVRRKSYSSPVDAMTVVLSQLQGCKASLLSQFWREGPGKPSQTITPQFTTTFTSFRDLHFNNQKKTLVKYKTNICLPFSVLEAKGLPSFEDHPEIKVKGYQLRISLYDKTSVLSNVHTLKARLVKGVWKFSSRDSVLFPSDDENTCLVRTNAKDNNISLLFELTALIDDADESRSELIEVCCAWGSLPLYSPEGNKIDSKTYEIMLFQGNANDKITQSFAPSPQKGFLAKLTSSIIYPTLYVKLWRLSSFNKKQFGRLPETIVTHFNAVPLIILYRQIFASVVYEQNWEGSLDSLNEPLLTAIPHLADKPALFKALCREWQSRFKVMRRKDRRSLIKKKIVLSDIVMNIWPLVYATPSKIAFPNQIETEEFYIDIIKKMKASPDFWTKHYKDIQVTPFSIQELCI